MWPWRDWLVRSLNANLPFHRLTERMLAGDLLMPPPHRAWQSADWIEDAAASELLLATGFLRNHRYDTGSGTIPAESKFENAADRLETVGTVWMGLTLQCARCHSHKYDPIENREYYELLAFFDKVPEVGSALKNASHPYVHVPDPAQRQHLNQLRAAQREAEANWAALAPKVDAAQRRWEQQLARETNAVVRVTRSMKHRFAATGIKFNGNNKTQRGSEPVKMCAGNKTWTISFSFRSDDLANGAIFSSVFEPERYRPGIQADVFGGKLRVRHVCRWVNSYIEFKGRERLKPNTWYHVTFRCDGRMQGLGYRASLDGRDEAMVCTHPVTNDSAANAGKAPLVLGGSPLLRGFRGTLRDLRFYDRVLAADEVRSLADARSTAALAAVPRPERSRDETATLRLAFLESDALPEPLAAAHRAVLDAEAALRTAVKETPTTMVMRNAGNAPTHVRLTGIYDRLGDEVQPGTPAALPPLIVDKPNRITLAAGSPDPTIR